MLIWVTVTDSYPKQHSSSYFQMQNPNKTLNLVSHTDRIVAENSYPSDEELARVWEYYQEHPVSSEEWSRRVAEAWVSGGEQAEK